MLEIGVHQVIAMQAVRGENHQHEKIRNHDGHIEGVKLIQPAKWIPVRVGKLGPVVRERTLRRRRQEAQKMLRRNQNGNSPLSISVSISMRALRKTIAR